ncbi:hypothetical protein PHMEG_0002906 [Phytophthora megakarya]|uniref:Uncharacterized protein n=1 Tax=Phytophthora megakarya TaxID=4795 RepID=A0A225WZL3_9STRA|nr:hypothetical protein PHMEG_0002906 [Phytophthora megakarya]
MSVDEVMDGIGTFVGSAFARQFNDKGDLIFISTAQRSMSYIRRPLLKMLQVKYVPSNHAVIKVHASPWLRSRREITYNSTISSIGSTGYRHVIQRHFSTD